MLPRPLQDRVLVKVAARKEKTDTGLVIPDTVKDASPLVGQVIAVGPGIWIDGVQKAPNVDVGCHVMFPQYFDGYSIKSYGDDYVVIKEDQLICVVDAPAEA